MTQEFSPITLGSYFHFKCYVGVRDTTLVGLVVSVKIGSSKAILPRDQLEVFSASEIAYMPAYRVGNFKSWMRCQCELTTRLHFNTSLPPAPKLAESNEVDM